MHRANNLRLVYFTEEEIKEMQDEIFFCWGTSPLFKEEFGHGCLIDFVTDTVEKEAAQRKRIMHVFTQCRKADRKKNNHACIFCAKCAYPQLYFHSKAHLLKCDVAYNRFQQVSEVA